MVRLGHGDGHAGYGDLYSRLMSLLNRMIPINTFDTQAHDNKFIAVYVVELYFLSTIRMRRAWASMPP